jgi:membrane protein
MRSIVKRWSSWWRTSDSMLARWMRAAHEALLGEMPILAAGTALFAIIAVVPTLAAAVALYGLIADPHEIAGQLSELRHVLPVEMVDFIAKQLERQASRSSGELGVQLGVSIFLAVFSARGSARALIDSLNRAYRVRELRSGLVRLALTLMMSTATLIGLITMFAVLVALPAIVGAINHHWVQWAMLLRWPALLAVVFLALLALYRFGPSPRPLGPKERVETPLSLPPPPMRHICLPGAAIATVLLLIVSWGLSLYVDNIATTELVYGAFGSVIVTVLWFYFSTMALLIGGFVNAELERHRGAPEPDRSMY